MASKAAGRLVQLLDFRWRQMLTGTRVRMCMTLGKGELGYPDLLAEELFCLRYVAPENPGNAA